MAWWPGDRRDAATPQVATSTLCAADDPRYRAVTQDAAADLGFVHLRWATPGLPVVDANTHPFAHGPWAFAHNGAIHPQERLDEILPAGWKARMRGTTDSERYFLAIVARLEDGASVRDAVALVAEEIFTRFEPTSLNAMLLGPDALHIIAAHDPARVPTVGASSRGGSESGELDTVFYDLHHRQRDHSFVVASSGFRQAADEGWQPVPNMTLLSIERATLATSMETLMPSGTQLVS
jgi:predicted glutamine amidotransferase